MTHEEFAEFIEKVERFDGVIYSQANRHLDAGEDQAAGALLLLKARLLVCVNRYRSACITEPAPLAAPAAAPVDTAAARCRHDFVASEARGENPPTCSKCKAPKGANGRPRKQQVLAAAGVTP